MNAPLYHLHCTWSTYSYYGDWLHDSKALTLALNRTPSMALKAPTHNVSMKSGWREGRVQLERGFEKGVKSCSREQYEVGIALTLHEIHMFQLDRKCMETRC